MSEEAKITMLVYTDLKPDEENKLKAIDGDIWQVLAECDINKRAIWTSYSDTEDRLIRLCIAGKSQPEILFELPAEKVADLSANDIVSLLRICLE